MTVAIYRKVDGKMSRIGTFTCREKWHNSIRVISQKFFEAHPNITQEQKSQYYVANRRKLMGVWIDGEQLPMDIE